MKRRGRNEGGISFLENRNAWVASVFDGYDEKGKPKYRKVQRKTKTEATKALAELKAELASGRPRITGRRTVGDWLDEWLDDFVKPTLAPKTYAFYEQMVRNHIRPKLGRIELKRLDPQTIARFYNGKRKEFADAEKSQSDGGRKQVAGEQTISAIHRTLRAAMNKALKLGYIAYCPVNSATGGGGATSKHAEYLTPEEASRLIEAAKGSPIANLVTFCLMTGVRVGEATGLRVTDLNLDKGTFRVEVQLQRNGKEWTLRPLKTDSSRRELPLSRMAREAVQNERSRHLVEGTENPLNLVFLNPYGRPFHQKYVNDHFHKVLKKAGLAPMGIHSLRHTAATIMLQHGENIQMVQRSLGHSTINLTANTYGHVLADKQADAMNKIDEAIRKHQKE